MDFSNFFVGFLDGSCNLAGTDASGANVFLGNCAVFFNSDSLDIGVPFPSCMSVGVAHVITGYLSFTTDFTFI